MSPSRSGRIPIHPVHGRTRIAAWIAALLRPAVAVLGVAILVAACGQGVPQGTSSHLVGVPTSVGPSASASDALLEPPSVAPQADGSSAVPPAATPAQTAGTIDVRVVRSDLVLPSARSRAVAFAFGSTIVVCGGLSGTGRTTGSIFGLDLGTGRISMLGVLAAPVHDAGGAVFGSSGFVVGGGSVVPGSTVQRIDPSGRTTTVGHLPAVRADLATVSIGDRLLVIGGGTAAGPDVRVLATVDGSHFQTIARLIVGVRYPAVAVVGDLVYVIGGSTQGGDTRVIQTIDPQTGVVRIVGRLAHGLSHASAIVVDGNLLIAGGRTAGLAQDDLLRFDIASGAVTRIGRLPYAVSDMAALVADGTGYLIGGEGRHPLATILAVTARS